MPSKILSAFLVYVFVQSVTSGKDERMIEVTVTVDTTKRVNYVEKYFLSFTIDSNAYIWHFLAPDKFNFSSAKLHTIMRGLSPAMLRIGGTSSDYLFYNRSLKVMNSLKFHSRIGVVTWTDIVNLIELTRSTGTRLIFDLNLQVRMGTQWDPSNALELIDFCSQMGFCESMDWELGNEPDWYERGNKVVLTPQQIGKDYRTLKGLLSHFRNCQTSAIYGPDTSQVTSSAGGDILSGFANMTGHFVGALTFHHYYFGGNTATPQTYLNASYFADLGRVIDRAKSLVSKSLFPHLPLWLGETSDAYNAGTKDVSDRFVSGFLWMDKLGVAAAMGLKAVLRQQLYGGYYTMLDKDFNPNPDYWLSWIHKKFVGQSVFSVSVSGVPSPPTTRVYAHCTKTEGSSYRPGALTVFALNIDQNVASSLSFSGQFAKQRFHVYLLEADEPGNVLSKFVKVNGIRLMMPTDNSMPQLVPNILAAGTSVKLPPTTMAFIVFPDASIELCPERPARH